MTVNPPIDANGPAQYTSDRSPTAADSDYSLQSLWYVTDGGMYMLIDNTPGAAVWQEIAKSPLAKAWVSFNGSNGEIFNSYNVLSVIRNSTGSYSVAYTSSLDNDYYAIAVSTSGSSPMNAISSQNASGCEITTSELQTGAAVFVDPTAVSVICFG